MPPPRKTALPVDDVLSEIVASLRRAPNLVIEAPPGAGKTTRVPPALLDVVSGEVLVLEPRRIAARLAARRVAFEMGEEVGATVGYQVRFEEVAGASTRLKFVTEGILTRRFVTDPELRGVGAVVLDEFHERHLDTDLALALLKRLQQRRRDLRIIAMSATLEADPVARFLGNCPIVRSEGKLYDVAITHQPYSPEPLEKQVRRAVDTLIANGDTGDILTFLPGAAEIHRAMRECEALARSRDLLVVPLHGSLTPAEQDRAIQPAAQRKVILATNVAESSITVEGVTAVIDSGLARTASYSPWTGLPTLHVARIAKASARQRAGRAGRIAPGRVVRLYAQEDFAQRADHDTPEILRSDLSQLLLSLRAMNTEHVRDVEWLDAPPEAAVTAAENLLDRLNAHGAAAVNLARYPVAPRLARVLVDAAERGVAEQAAKAVALLSSGQQLERVDLFEAMERPLDPRTRQHFDQLRRLVNAPRKSHAKHDDDALLKSLLAGFPDRVARLGSAGQLSLSNGASAELSGARPQYEFMVAVDAEDRRDKPLPIVRVTARIEPEWLLDLFPDRVRDRNEVVWNDRAQRVDAVSALVYDELVIEESRGAAPDPEAAAALLAHKAIEAGIERFVDRESLDAFLARVDFAGLPAPDLEATLRELCSGLRSFTDLKKSAADFLPTLERRAGAHLNELAPLRLRLPSGRHTVVHYDPGKDPWIASRLQDFFGMHETPRIGRDRRPLVVHLLAPNQRPVQTTTDLAGFWERLYPQVRRELMRRYPKHAWPEKP